MFNLVLMTKESIRKEYNNSAVHEGALQKSDVYFVNRKKNQKHKKVLELKEDAEETTDENNKKETTTAAEKEEEATTPSEE